MKSVLHTSSAYAVTEIDLNFSNESHSKSSIGALEAKEREVYAKFGAADYREFREKIKDLLDPNDQAVIARFAPENLKSEIELYTTQSAGIYEPEVRFVFDLTKINESNEKIKEEMKKSLTLKKDTKIEVKEVDLSFGISDKELQDKIVELFKYHRYKKDWSKYLHNFTRTLSNIGVLTAYGKDSDTGEFTVPLKFAQIPNFPWGVMKDDVELARQLGTESELFKELVRATKSIYNFIFNVLGEGKTPVLHQAMRRVWHRNFKKYESDPALFFHGTTTSNFVSSVQGALGEFQAAVIFEYLGDLIGESSFSKILGNKYKQGEQLRTDVQIFKEAGIQVKNFNSFMKNGDLGFLKDRKIGSTIHPVDFSEYLDDRNNFLDFLANYYFNTSYQQEVQNEFEQLVKELGEYLGELMNMSMGETLSDTFSFYLVSGKYLIPGSEILKMAEEIDLKNSIEITSSYRGLPDLDYEVPILEGKNGKRRPLFSDYWTKTSAGGWKPTQKNSQTYKSLVEKNISMRTSFDLIKKIEQYAIY